MLLKNFLILPFLWMLNLTGLFLALNKKNKQEIHRKSRLPKRLDVAELRK